MLIESTNLKTRYKMYEQITIPETNFSRLNFRLLHERYMVYPFPVILSFYPFQAFQYSSTIHRVASTCTGCHLMSILTIRSVLTRVVMLYCLVHEPMFQTLYERSTAWNGPESFYRKYVPCGFLSLQNTRLKVIRNRE